jgi:hypothetical protein
MNNDSITRLHALKHALATHHKNVVEQFHKKHGETLKKAKKHSLSLVSAALIAASVAQGHIQILEHQKQQHKQQLAVEQKNLTNFLDTLPKLLAGKNTLSKGEEDVIAQALSSYFKLNLKPSLDGNRLNEVYGYVGAEQHLYRWAGDTLGQHDVQRSGIAPLQGAFKDFDNAEQEKYYVAVQLHELPTWNKDWPTLKPWYRYRKIFMYNPVNQKGIIAVIGDAGPSKWTGKTFGGSPEVMQYLHMVDGAQKGKAFILFIDDPENKIALGPVDVSKDQLLATK